MEITAKCVCIQFPNHGWVEARGSGALNCVVVLLRHPERGWKIGKEGWVVILERLVQVVVIFRFWGLMGYCKFLAIDVKPRYYHQHPRL